MAIASAQGRSATPDPNAVEQTIKLELIPEVADLSVLSPAQELRRSPRKRAAVSLKEESEDEGTYGKSKYWLPSSPPIRRSSRKPVLKKQDEDDDALPTLRPTTMTKTTVKRKAARQARTSSPKKVKREYAPPEAYAHLELLPDYLKEHLDVMFCGINPGCKSAETGHHFAHCTNHFWKALHESGFTNRLLRPEEDSTLPGSYNIGLTNLVERPSAEQAELSLDDMKSGVPALLAKIALYQPRVVCFVGKGIGEVFLKEASTSAVSPSPPTCPAPAELSHESSSTGEGSTAKAPGVDGPGLAAVSPSVTKDGERRKATKAKTKASKRPAFAIGFQPYKVVHPPHSVVHETLFYIMPSSSARVTGYQLGDKAKILRTLYEEVQKAKAGSGMDTRDMQVIEVVPVKLDV